MDRDDLIARQNLTVPRLFARFGLPHADPARVVRGNGKGDIYTPSSGRFVRRDGEEWLLARSYDAGLPWGKWSRMIVILLATEARRKQHRTVRLPSIGRVLEALTQEVVESRQLKIALMTGGPWDEQLPHDRPRHRFLAAAVG